MCRVTRDDFPHSHSGTSPIIRTVPCSFSILWVDKAYPCVFYKYYLKVLFHPLFPPPLVILHKSRSMYPVCLHPCKALLLFPCLALFPPPGYPPRLRLLNRRRQKKVLFIFKGELAPAVLSPSSPFEASGVLRTNHRILPFRNSLDYPP